MCLMALPLVPATAPPEALPTVSTAFERMEGDDVGEELGHVSQYERHLCQPHALQTNVTNAIDTPSAAATAAVIAGTAYT